MDRKSGSKIRKTSRLVDELIELGMTGTDLLGLVLQTQRKADREDWRGTKSSQEAQAAFEIQVSRRGVKDRALKQALGLMLMHTVIGDAPMTTWRKFAKVLDDAQGIEALPSAVDKGFRQMMLEDDDARSDWDQGEGSGDEVFASEILAAAEDLTRTAGGKVFYVNHGRGQMTLLSREVFHGTQMRGDIEELFDTVDDAMLKVDRIVKGPSAPEKTSVRVSGRESFLQANGQFVQAELSLNGIEDEEAFAEYLEGAGIKEWRG